MPLTHQQIGDYLSRIGCSIDLKPTLEVLNHLQERHLYSIPFENLDIHYDTLIVLDVDSILDKIIQQNRGGICYELNGVFHELLLSIGYKVKRIVGSVHDTKTDAYGHAFDHLSNIVKLDGQDYLVDVGFGEFALYPLMIELNLEQEDPRGKFRIVQHEEPVLRVEKEVNGNWKPEFIFRKEARAYADFQEGCTYHQTSPDSIFTQKKSCSIAKSDGRISLSGKKLKITTGDRVEEQPVSSEEVFLKQLQLLFGIQL